MGKNNYPKHTGRGQQPSNQQSDRGHAHAPYNFVPLNDQVLPGERVDHNQYFADKHTGYFDVTLETKTPLFVRGMITEADMRNGGDKTDTPFMLNDKPVIPGSSLRGMIRAIVEIITFGKIHFVDDANKFFFRAVAAKKDDPQGQFYKNIMGNPNLNTHAGKNVAVGYLRYENGNWFVQPAQPFGEDRPFALVKDKPNVVKGVRGIRHLNSHDYRLARFEVDYIENQGRIIEVFTPTNQMETTAWLVCTGNMAQTQGGNQPVRTNRKNFVLIKKAYQKNLIPIPEYVTDAYKQGLTPFQIGGENGEQQSKNYFHEENGILKEGNIVFYIVKENQIIQFGHTPNFRLAHYNAKNKPTNPLDFVPNNLLDPYFTDYADAMFGYVSDEGFEPNDTQPVAYSGRISFTNASLGDGQTDFKPRKTIIRILGTPKPTTFQHYLEQPNGVNTPKPELTHYGKKGARIRGYKLYWHKHVTLNRLPETEVGYKERPNVDVHLKPLREGLTFTFRVYFENLTDAELGALAWALSLDDMPDGNRHHMLGMAKPYGLGVVKLAPTLYLSDRKARYQSLFDEDGIWHQPQKRANYMYFINQFIEILRKEAQVEFNNSKRIQELFALLTHTVKDPDDPQFIYMTIEPVNEYKDRPVLPRPREVLKGLEKDK